MLHNSWQQQRFIEGAAPATVGFKLISSESSEPAECVRSAQSLLEDSCTLLQSDFHVFILAVPAILCTTTAVVIYSSLRRTTASGVLPPTHTLLPLLTPQTSGPPLLHLGICSTSSRPPAFHIHCPSNSVWPLAENTQIDR